METNEILNIETPENVIFGYDVAGIGSRFIAALADSLIILALQALVYFTLFLIMGEETLFESENVAWITALFSFIGFALLWGYYIFFEMLWNGQSPGKRWSGLRVVRADGTPITLAESLVRNLVRLIDFLPFLYGVGVVTMFVNNQSRRLGDFAAGTLVVRDKKAMTIAALEMTAQEPNLVGYHFSEEDLNMDFPLEKLTAKDIQVAEEYLRRRVSLPNRSRLARDIVTSLYSRMEIPLPYLPEGRPEKLVAIIVRLSRQKNQATEG
jgi:uncharacterized RDD family membrane protein YckC